MSAIIHLHVREGASDDTMRAFAEYVQRELCEHGDHAIVTHTSAWDRVEGETYATEKVVLADVGVCWEEFQSR